MGGKVLKWTFERVDVFYKKKENKGQNEKKEVKKRKKKEKK